MRAALVYHLQKNRKCHTLLCGETGFQQGGSKWAIYRNVDHNNVLKHVYVCVCAPIHTCQCKYARNVFSYLYFNKLISLFINIAPIHIQSNRPHLSPAAPCYFDAAVTWAATSNTQPYAAKLILERGPCLKWLCGAVAKSARRGIN